MKKFNAIDIIIIAVIVAGIAAVGLLKLSGGTADTQETKTITLELTEKRVGFSKNVVIGDSVTEKVKKTQIGTVTGVKAIPSERNSYNTITGEALVASVPEREHVYVTIEVNQDADVAVGKMLSIITKHFAGAGYVTAIAE